MFLYDQLAVAEPARFSRHVAFPDNRFPMGRSRTFDVIIFVAVVLINKVAQMLCSPIAELKMDVLELDQSVLKVRGFDRVCHDVQRRVKPLPAEEAGLAQVRPRQSA
ncbi:MAG TPA: hypothetical protein PLE37_10415 [Pseudomonadota bacterium]|nr:hypothetical protein [Pseudomonadota bacterium]